MTTAEIDYVRLVLSLHQDEPTITLATHVVKAMLAEVELAESRRNMLARLHSPPKFAP